MKHLTLLLLFFSLSSVALRAEEKPAPAPLFVRMYRVPRDLFTDKAGKLKEGIKVIPSLFPDASPQYDVRGFFEQNGYPLHPEEAAIFQSGIETLMLRGRRETIEGAQMMGFGGDFAAEDSPVRIEASVVEFSTAKMPDGEIPSSFDALRHAAGDSWHVVSRTNIVTKFQQRASTDTRSGGASEGRSASASKGGVDKLSSGEAGVRLEVEPILDPYGRTMDINMTYSYRAEVRGGLKCDVITSVRAVPGEPVVVQVAPAVSEVADTVSNKYCALILRAVIEKINPRPWPQEKHPDSPAKP